jgi:hypothetical protein
VFTQVFFDCARQVAIRITHGTGQNEAEKSQDEKFMGGFVYHKGLGVIRLIMVERYRLWAKKSREIFVARGRRENRQIGKATTSTGLASVAQSTAETAVHLRSPAELGAMAEKASDWIGSDFPCDGESQSMSVINSFQDLFAG